MLARTRRPPRMRLSKAIWLRITLVLFSFTVHNACFLVRIFSIDLLLSDFEQCQRLSRFVSVLLNTGNRKIGGNIEDADYGYVVVMLSLVWLKPCIVSTFFYEFDDCLLNLIVLILIQLYIHTKTHYFSNLKSLSRRPDGYLVSCVCMVCECEGISFCLVEEFLIYNVYIHIYQVWCTVQRVWLIPSVDSHG